MKKAVCLLIVFITVFALGSCAAKKPTDDELYAAAVRDAVFADEDEVLPLVNITKDDKNVIWSEDGKSVLVSFMHKYRES